MEILHPVEIRVLGSLLEKDLTTPEYYPLTVNALLNACNQKSSREPVVHYDETTVEQALVLLRDKHLASRVSGVGHRVEKYGHRLGETVNLGRRELSVLCVLMLRGPQTVGEIRGRTDRMHSFSDLDEVEHVLESLASRSPDPFVAPVGRGRWMHLLGGAEAAASSVTNVEDADSRVPASDLAQRVSFLETELAQLKQEFENLRRQLE